MGKKYRFKDFILSYNAGGSPVFTCYCGHNMSEYHNTNGCTKCDCVKPKVDVYEKMRKGKN